jgi:hypothetical protein
MRALRSLLEREQLEDWFRTGQYMKLVFHIKGSDQRPTPSYRFVLMSKRSSVQSSWPQIQMSGIGFQVLSDFLRNSLSGTGSTQPREDNCGAS